MDPQQLLTRMCRRHGLPQSGTERLLPLIERALISPEDVRERILTIVDQSLARQAAGSDRVNPEHVFRDLDAETLKSVAKLLHNWAPSTDLLDMPGTLGHLFREDGQDDTSGD